MTSPDVIVVGAGVLGLASAAELAADGLAVTVVDPGGANASSVAAGMIAPAMESVLDDLPPATVAVLKSALALWPPFAARHGLDLIQYGADWVGPDADLIADRLVALGFRARREAGWVHAPDDARIDPPSALESLAATATVVRGRVVRVGPVGGGWTVVLEDASALSARHLVLATGAAEAVEGLSARVFCLVGGVMPIRGQIARLPRAALATVARTPAGYAVPACDGVLIGASMEPGRRDLTPDPAAARTQVEAVCAVLGLERGETETRVGIRGATADGLPIVGAVDGVHLALAPRRNGWLLAPLVARIVADAIQGRPPIADAVALDPVRFSPGAG